MKRSGGLILAAVMSDHDPFDLDLQQERDDLVRVAERLANENDDADIVWLMSGPKGRRIVRRVLEFAGVFRTSFVPNTMQMALLEGKKQVGYWLLGCIQDLCPESYHTMIQESKHD